MMISGRAPRKSTISRPSRLSVVFAQPTNDQQRETPAVCRQSSPIARTGYNNFSRSAIPRARTKLYSVCGNIQKPGNYEVPMGFPFKDFLYELCGGPLPGRKFRAIIPGGISVPIQTLAEAEASLMDYEGFVAQGSMLGSGGVIVVDDEQNLVKFIARAARFFAHESCAQCTQCREGTAWTTKIVERIAAGEEVRRPRYARSIADNMTADDLRLERSCATPVVRDQQVPRKISKH